MATKKLYKRPITTNVFVKGMNSDIDVLQQPKDTVRFTNNADLVFNEGKDFAYRNLNSNQLLASLKTGYTWIGGGVCNDKLLVVSTNEINSELGIFTYDDQGTFTYQTIFNDMFDPNGDKFSFSFMHPLIPPVSVIENEETERMYLSDDFNEAYTFNIVAGLQVNNADFTNGDYQPLNTGKYPWWYSVHSSKRLCDWKMDRIKFIQKHVGGSLKTGIYQITYRMISKEGYATPWYPLTRHFFLTDIDQTTVTTMHDYYMSASNIQTDFQLQFTIPNLDTRFYKIQIAYVYSIDYNATVEANIFYDKVIDATTPSLTFDLNGNFGTPVDIPSLSIQKLSFRTIGTEREKDQRIFSGNITTDSNFLLDLSQVTFAPKLRSYVADILTNPTTTPLTDTSITTTNVSIQSYVDKSNAPVTELYAITNDYQNYKGTQFEHLFAGHWRGETYGYAVTWYDKKGIPFYSQPMPDYTFPNQWDNNGAGDYSLGSAGSLNILGVIISNLKVPITFFHDDWGNMRVSGFSIDRCARVPSILMQGVIQDTVVDPHTNTQTLGLPFTNESFGAFANDNDQFDYTGYLRNAGETYTNRPFTFTFTSPEIAFGYNFFAQTGQTGVLPTDFVQITAIVKDGNSTPVCGVDPATPYGGTELSGNYLHFYTKNYLASSSESNDSQISMFSLVELMIPFTSFVTDITAYDPEQPTLMFHNTVEVYGCSDNANTCADMVQDAGQTIYSSMLMKLKDMKNVIPTDAANKGIQVSVFKLANYVSKNTSYYSSINTTTGVSTLRRYYGTNHFQPITQAILDTLPVSSAFVDGVLVPVYVFNGIEVWGGDCYVNLFDVLRLYPVYHNCNTNAGPCYRDYAVGMIVPMESNLNIALRKGRNYAAVASRPEADSCNADSNFVLGASINYPESFYLNSALLQQENVYFHPQLPINLTKIDDAYPSRWIYTEQKTYSEVYDSYRSVLSNNFYDVQGLYGAIKGSVMFGDQLYSFQERGFGRLRVNDRTLFNTAGTDQVFTGFGAALAGIDYFSHETGCSTANGVLATDYYIYFIDVIRATLNRYGSQGLEVLTDTKGEHAWASANIKAYRNETFQRTPRFIYSTARIAYDRVNRRIYFLLCKQSTQQTIVFNELADAFTTFPAINTYFMIGFDDYLLSIKPNTNNIYLHNITGQYGQFYDTYYDTVISVIVNPISEYDCKFDNIEMNINAAQAFAQLSSITMITETQQQQIINIQTGGLFQALYNRIRGQLFDITQEQRVQGKHVELQFTFKNDTSNTAINFTSLLTYFRIAKRL